MIQGHLWFVSVLCLSFPKSVKVNCEANILAGFNLAFLMGSPNSPNKLYVNISWFTVYHAIFEVFYSPNDYPEILALTFRYSHNYCRTTLWKLRDCPISHTLPQCYLKVIAKHSGA